jgi:hypothetical protein
MLKYFSTFACIIFSFFIVNGQEYISLNGDSIPNLSTCQIIGQGTNYVEFDVEISGFYKQDTTINYITYQRISLLDNYTTSNVGMPELPIINKLVYVPDSCTINISISNIVVDTIHNYVVFPYQSLSIESDTVNIFELDSAYYSCDSIYPFEYTIVSQSKRFRNIDVVNMAIQAFNYNPYNKRLSIIKSFQVRLDFDKSYTDSIKYELKPIQEMYNYTVANYNPLITKSQATDDTYDLLIIAPDDYLSNSDLLEFIAWKNQKGYKTKLISTLVTGNTPSSIKNYIENEFLDK